MIVSAAKTRQTRPASLQSKISSHFISWYSTQANKTAEWGNRDAGTAR